eukprot:1176671-Prorocentrum_minimum.AAC.1
MLTLQEGLGDGGPVVEVGVHLPPSHRLGALPTPPKPGRPHAAHPRVRRRLRVKHQPQLGVAALAVKHPARATPHTPQRASAINQTHKRIRAPLG